MKKGEVIVLRILQGWSFILGTMVISALIYAFAQIIMGNVHGTASFEF